MRLFLSFVFVTLLSGFFCQNSRRDSIYDRLRREQADSAKAELYNRLGKYFVRNFAYDSAIVSAGRSINFSKPHRLLSKWAYALDVIGTAYLRLGDNGKAGIFYDSAITLIKNSPRGWLYYNINEHLGTVQYYTGNLDSALALYNKTLNYSILQKNELLQETCYNNIGNVYGTLGNEHQKAIENYLAALRISKKLNDTSLIISVCSNLGVEYGFISEYDKAIQYHNESLNLAERTGNKAGVATALSNLGTVYHLQQKFQKSIEMFRLASDIEEKYGNRFNLANIVCGISQGYLELGDYAQARKFGLKTLEVALETGNVDTQHIVYQTLSRIEEVTGNPAKALAYYKLYIQTRDSLYNNQTEKRILEIEIQNKFEREKAIAQLQREQKEADLVSQNKVKDLELWRTRLVTGSVIAALVFVLIVVLLILRQRRLKADKIAVQLEQKALRAQMNPHFLFNSLNSIQRLFIEGKKDAASDAIADFSSLLRRILNNSSVPLVSLKEELETLQLYMELERMRSDNGFTYEIKTDAGMDLSFLKVPPLVLQPFVENAIWHGILPAKREGRITVEIKVSAETGFLHCEISDNGMGIDLNKLNNPESKGIQITEQRLGRIVKFVNLPDGGTKVTLLIPLTQ